MDHLPTCAASPNVHPRIPLLQGCDYDGKGFSGFPNRMGFDKTRLLSGDFTEQSDEATAALLQAWLYFGLLIEVMGDGLRREDFVYQDDTGRHFITTETLPQYIEERSKQLRKSKSASAELAIRSCLDEANMFASLLSGGLSGPTTCPLSPEISLSIMALVSSIEAALWHAEKSIGFQIQKKRWGCSMYLHNKMLLDGWCPNDLRRLHEYGSVPLMYSARHQPLSLRRFKM
jgi:hypothetical protein